MKLPPSFWLFAIAWFLAPEAVAGQQIKEMERGQKARPDPVPMQITSMSI